MLAVFGDVKAKALTAGRGHGLVGQVNSQLIAFVGFHFLEQLVNDLLRQNDGQQAIFVTVVEKDVRKRWGNHGAKTIIVQCPRRMFAARAAAEVFAREQNVGRGVTGLIENEIRV